MLNICKGNAEQQGNKRNQIFEAKEIVHTAEFNQYLVSVFKFVSLISTKSPNYV